MNLIQQISQFNISNVFFSDPIKNNIINDSLFNRLIYSTSCVSLNGISVFIPMQQHIIEKNYYKYKCSFDIHLNHDIIEQIKQIEVSLLTSISSLCNGLTPQYKIAEQLHKGNIYFFSTNNRQNIIILKISGIWSNTDSYGLTYKFMQL